MKKIHLVKIWWTGNKVIEEDPHGALKPLANASEVARLRFDRILLPLDGGAFYSHSLNSR
jgi:hypothetical protein